MSSYNVHTATRRANNILSTYLVEKDAWNGVRAHGWDELLDEIVVGRRVGHVLKHLMTIVEHAYNKGSLSDHPRDLGIVVVGSGNERNIWISFHFLHFDTRRHESSNMVSSFDSELQEVVSGNSIGSKQSNGVSVVLLGAQSTDAGFLAGFLLDAVTAFLVTILGVTGVVAAGASTLTGALVTVLHTAVTASFTWTRISVVFAEGGSSVFRRVIEAVLGVAEMLGVVEVLLLRDVFLFVIDISHGGYLNFNRRIVCC